MKRVQLLTPWTGSGQEGDDRRPAVVASHALRDWADVTGQPAEHLPTQPNALVIEALVEESVLAALEADPDYQGCVLWEEEA